MGSPGRNAVAEQGMQPGDGMINKLGPRRDGECGKM